MRMLANRLRCGEGEKGNRMEGEGEIQDYDPENTFKNINDNK